jgi:IS605 OrfB family transposase
LYWQAALRGSMIQIIHGEIWSDDFKELETLIRDFQSCVRFSYCRFGKDKMVFNDVRKVAKAKYPMLNTRQVSDSVVQAQGLNTRLKGKKVIFGGRKAWEDLKLGTITKDEWLSRRDNQIYCRGDKTQKGNLNIRIINDTLRITVGTRKWVSYKLFIPKKYQQDLKIMLSSGRAYNVRLKRKDNQHFKVMIDCQIEPPEVSVNFQNGVIGVDTNPDRIAVADVSADGNLVTTETFINTRILYASSDKRDYDIGCLIKKVIGYALERGKGIVFEDLKFDKDKSGSHQWKRKQSNFIWKRFITLLERKCMKNGIQYKKVNPAFTSIIGKYKYRWMYKTSIHESAAFVIGRRGLGYNEKLSFYKQSHERVKEAVIETLAGKYDDKRIHSWRLWKALNDNIEAVLTGLQVRLADLKEFVGNIWYRGEKLRGEVFLRELLAGSVV